MAEVSPLTKLLGASLFSFGVAIVMLACHSNPSINGDSVPPVGSLTVVPTCAQICNRLVALCGYAPVDCTTEDGGGYCDTQITDDTERTCIGFGSDDGDGGVDLTKSCQAAWDCVANFVPPDSDAATDDGATADDAGDDSGNDAGL